MATRLRALVLDKDRLDFDGALDWSELSALTHLTIRAETATDRIATVAAGHDVLISKETRIDEQVVAALPASVRLICEAGTGYDNIDVERTRARNVTVCNVPGYSTAAVAQLTMSYVLGIASGTIGYVRRASLGDRDDFRRLTASPSEVAGKTLGIVGPGTIGSEVTRLARAFDMQVLTSGRSERIWDDANVRHVPLPTLLGASDFVSLHCPLDKRPGPDSTWRLVGRDALARMKRSAWLLNTSRGGLVDEAALVEALREQRIAGAALDVQDPEPPSADSPLWRFPNVHLTPHVGWKAIEARQRLLAEVANNIRAFADGGAVHVIR